MSYNFNISTNSEWVTAIRYYRGLEARKAPMYLRTARKPVEVITIAYAILVFAVVATTVLALLGNFS